MQHRFLMLVFAALTLATEVRSKDYLVQNQAEFKTTHKKLAPGDRIVLANGNWKDFQIVLQGKGKAGNPITLTAETPGKVVITGESNLRMAGEHLVVSNLVFRNGASPTGEVISTRINRTDRANHSRITGVVVDHFNKADRSEQDHWVALYGKHNRFDHNHLIGKNNAGTTMVVVRDEEQGLENRHRIDHNWFGPRPNLGANGGETMRIGTSADSLSDSHTLVERNWFEGCDGEVEIVSNKSGANTFRGNVFFRSRGSLVLRHGDGNLVEDNVFLGENQAHTGGIRVINRAQTIRNNYMEGLAGDGFAAALTIMYGVPNSPINRYTQVERAIIENNTIVDANSLFFGAGMDQERSLAPTRSRFARNLIANAEGNDPFKVLGDLSGIAIAKNIQVPKATKYVANGIVGNDIKLKRAATGLLVAAGYPNVGARRDLKPVARADVGVSWYPKETAALKFDDGSTHHVEPGDDTLSEAIARARAGDRLRLVAGNYTVNKLVDIRHPISLIGPENGGAKILFSRPTLFQIEKGGSLKLTHVWISGAQAPDNVGNAVIRTRTGSGAANFTIIMEDSIISELTVNRRFDVIALGKQSMADRILLRRVKVENVSGSVVSASAERDDLGTYNAELVEIVDSQMSQIQSTAIDMYRGGTDESTFGPKLLVTGTRFDQVGLKSETALRLHGVQHADLRDNHFSKSAIVRFTHSVGEPVFLAARNTFVDTPAIDADISIRAAQ